MDTSGGGTLNALLYLVVLAACVAASARVLGDLGPWFLRPRPVALLVWLCVAIPSLVELVWHQIYDGLSRQPSDIKSGQVWRLLTSVAVQDGGVGGTVFNLVILLPIVILAAHLWGQPTTVLVFVAGVLLFNAFTTFVSPASGGGNSALTFLIAAAVTGLVAVRLHTLPTLAAAGATLAAADVLFRLWDAHAVAILAGLLGGAALAAARPADDAAPAWHGTEARDKMEA